MVAHQSCLHNALYVVFVYFSERYSLKYSVLFQYLTIATPPSRLGGWGPPKMPLAKWYELNFHGLKTKWSLVATRTLVTWEPWLNVSVPLVLWRSLCSNCGVCPSGRKRCPWLRVFPWSTGRSSCRGETSSVGLRSMRSLYYHVEFKPPLHRRSRRKPRCQKATQPHKEKQSQHQ